MAIEVERLAQVHSDRLGLLEATVEDVPPMHPDTGGTGDAGDAGGAGAAGSNGRDLGLFRTEPATPDRAARIVVLRRPVEARARAGLAREHLVHRVVVEALAELLGLSPQDVDPDIDPNADDLGD